MENKEATVMYFFDEVNKIVYDYVKKNNYTIIFSPSYDFTTGIYTIEIKKAVSFYDYQVVKVISSTSQKLALDLVKKEVEGK